MRLAIVTLVLLLPAASAAEPPLPAKSAKLQPPTRLCRDVFKVQPAREPDRVQPRRLGELPPADMYLGVVNQVGGCIEPLKVRDGFGGR